MELNSIVHSQDQDLEALSITVMPWHTVCVWDYETTLDCIQRTNDENPYLQIANRKNQS
jgi:hypothetical protein